MEPSFLTEYGLEQEQSTLRAYVSVVAARVYVYGTRQGQDALRENGHREIVVSVPCQTCQGKQRACALCGGTNRVETARGRLVPPQDIKGCRSVVLPVAWLTKVAIDGKQSTSEKGEKAVRLVCWLMNAGAFPLPVLPREVADHDLQIQGTDILVRYSGKVQVKCDYRAGKREHGGTGYLFLQTHERNPWAQH